MTLPGGYTDSREYMTDLIVAAFEPHVFPGEAAVEAATYPAGIDGVRMLQADLADNPEAQFPDWMRDRLRALAAGTPAA